jgi:hypothetical protein
MGVTLNVMHPSPDVADQQRQNAPVCGFLSMGNLNVPFPVIPCTTVDPDFLQIWNAVVPVEIGGWTTT